MALQGMLDKGFVTLQDGEIKLKDGLKVLNHYRVKGAATGKRRDVVSDDEDERVPVFGRN